MNKLFSKIAALSAGLALAVGVGVAVGQSAKEVKADAEEAIIYQENFNDWTADSNYNNKPDSSQPAVEGEIEKPGDDTAVKKWMTYYAGIANSSKTIEGKSPMMRAYKNSGTHGGYFSTNFSLEKVTRMTFDVKVGRTQLNQGYKVYAKTSSGGDWTQKGTGTPSSTSTTAVEINIGLSSASTVWLKIELISDANSDTKNNYDVYFDNVVVYGMVEASAATEITLGSYDSHMTAGTSQSIQATIDSNVESINWTVDHPEVVSLSYTSTNEGVSTATLIAISNGSFVVTATASVTTSVHSSTSSISVDGAKGSGAPITLTAAALGFESTTYGDCNGYHAYKGFSVQTTAVARQGSDYTPSEGPTVIEKYALIFQKTNGRFVTKTNVGSKISKVIISHISETAPALSINGSDTIDGVNVSASDPTNVGMLFTYEFSTPVTYVTIAATSSSASYINSITFEFVGGAETVDSLADFILGLIPDRDDDTGLCLGDNGNYKLAKARVSSASAGVKSEFQTSENETVVKARERFEAWAAAYGDSTPYEATVSSIAGFDAGKTNSSTIIIIIAATFAITTFGAILLIRKKKHSK